MTTADIRIEFGVGESLKNIQRNGVQGLLMGSVQVYFGGRIVKIRVEPSGGTQTPPIPWFESRKGWAARRDEIVPLIPGVFQESLCDLSADGVYAMVLWSGVAEPITVETGFGKGTT